jgi:hypothetical protein
MGPHMEASCHASRDGTESFFDTELILDPQITAKTLGDSHLAEEDTETELVFYSFVSGTSLGKSRTCLPHGHYSCRPRYRTSEEDLSSAARGYR